MACHRLRKRPVRSFAQSMARHTPGRSPGGRPGAEATRQAGSAVGSPQPGLRTPPSRLYWKIGWSQAAGKKYEKRLLQAVLVSNHQRPRADAGEGQQTRGEGAGVGHPNKDHTNTARQSRAPTPSINVLCPQYRGQRDPVRYWDLCPCTSFQVNPYLMTRSRRQ